MRSALAQVWGGQAVVVTLPTAKTLPFDSLAPDILTRATAIRHDSTRIGFLSARFLLQRCLFALGPDAAGMRLCSPENGEKPFLIGGRQRLFVNISHTAGLVAVALCAEGEVGVDVERERVVADLPTLIQATLTAREQAAVGAAENPSQAFLRLWVRKESLLKAKGLGVVVDLKQWDVQAPAELTPAISLVDLTLPPGYVGALTLMGPLRAVVQIALSDLGAPAG